MRVQLPPTASTDSSDVTRRPKGMFNNDDKRKIRRMKADLKRHGARRKRRALKRQLDRSPEEATSKDDYEYGLETSVLWNGEVKDTKRAKMDREDEEE